MVARASTGTGFAPNERPRVAVAADGTLAAIQEPTRVSVVEVPSCAPFAELGTDSNAEANDVAWVGTPPRLLVVSRFAAHSTAHLVDPFGPRSLAEIRLETPMRLVAAVGAHALVIGPQGAAILAAGDTTLTPYAFPTRAVPLAAGAAGSQFMVALSGAIEEWDPNTRMPKRRLKLPRPAAITAVGGSERVVWMTTHQEPARIEVIALVNRGQPKAHELPEPIAQVASHPRSDLIACIGATSGRMWVVDLDGRVGLRMVGAEGIERPEAVGIVFGRVGGVLAAQAKRPVNVVTLDRSDGGGVDPEPPRPVLGSSPADKARSSLYGDGDDEDHQQDERPTSVTLAAPPEPAPPEPAPPVAPTQPASQAPPPVTAAAAKPVSRPALPQFGTPPSIRGTPTDPRTEALAGFRARIVAPRAPTAEPVATVWPDANPSWREMVVAWAQAGGETSQFPVGTPVEAIVLRLDVSPALEPVVAFMYAHHLLGNDGVAPIDISRFTTWDEALGRGELVARGVAVFAGSRMRLTDRVRRVLDDRAPLTGMLVGTPGVVSLLGPCVIVSAGPLAIVAEGCLASIGGAILAASADADPYELAAEARAYGAAPMWRVRIDQLLRVPADQPVILVADDDATADELGVPRLT